MIMREKWSSKELLSLKILQVATICMEDQLPLQLIMVETLLIIRVLCLLEASMASLPPICLPLILVQSDKACHQPIDQVSHLFTVDNRLSIKQLEALA